MQISDTLAMHIFAPAGGLKAVEKGADLPVFTLDIEGGPKTAGLVPKVHFAQASGTSAASLEDQKFTEIMGLAVSAVEVPALATREIPMTKADGEPAVFRKAVSVAETGSPQEEGAFKVVAQKTEVGSPAAVTAPLPNAEIEGAQATELTKHASATPKDLGESGSSGLRFSTDPFVRSQKGDAPTAPLASNLHSPAKPVVLSNDVARLQPQPQPQPQVNAVLQADADPMEPILENLKPLVRSEVTGSQPRSELPKLSNTAPTVPNADSAEHPIKNQFVEKGLELSERVQAKIGANTPVGSSAIAQPILDVEVQAKLTKTDTSVDKLTENLVSKQAVPQIVETKNLTVKPPLPLPEQKQTSNQEFLPDSIGPTRDAAQTSEIERTSKMELAVVEQKTVATVDRVTPLVPEPVTKNGPAIPEARLDGAIGQGAGAPGGVPDLDQPAPVPVMHPSRQAETAREIAVQIREATGDSRQIDIRLNPEELGRVRISINPNESGGMVSIVVERPETLDLMRRHLDQLVKEFKTAGWADVDLNLSQGQSGHSGSAQNGSGHQDSQNRPAPQGSLFEQLTTPDKPMQKPTLLSSDERLDLRI